MRRKTRLTRTARTTSAAESRRVPTPSVVTSNVVRAAAHGVIRAYQLTLSALVGRQCRHLPTCSAYADEAIQRHGLWAGGWMGAARICRCHPWGSAGFDPVPAALDPTARWYLPWRYGRWRRELSEPDLVNDREAPVNGDFRSRSGSDA